MQFRYLTSSALALALLGCNQKPATTAQPPPPASAPASAPAAPTSAPAAPASGPAATSTTGQVAPGDRVLGGRTPDDRDQVDPDGVVRRGAKLSAAEAQAVDAILATPEKWDGKSVKVTGVVETVCAKKGCWFQLRAATPGGIRITMADYGFFVPKAAVGMTVTLEGVLSVKTLDKDTAQHYADDQAAASGKPADKVEGPVREVGIVAAGLEMQKAG